MATTRLSVSHESPRLYIVPEPKQVSRRTARRLLSNALRGRNTFGAATVVLAGLDAYLSAKATDTYMYPVYNIISIAATIGTGGITAHLHQRVNELREVLRPSE